MYGGWFERFGECCPHLLFTLVLKIGLRRGPGLRSGQLRPPSFLIELTKPSLPFRFDQQTARFGPSLHLPPTLHLLPQILRSSLPRTSFRHLRSFSRSYPWRSSLRRRGGARTRPDAEEAQGVVRCVLRGSLEGRDSWKSGESRSAELSLLELAFEIEGNVELNKSSLPSVLSTSATSTTRSQEPRSLHQVWRDLRGPSTSLRENDEGG